MLKRTLYILIAFVIPSITFGQGSSQQALFASGNASYNKGQYKEALATYQKALNSGYESAALYFNIGNAYYKTGEIPSALLYYGKAHRLSPGDEDINFNIKFLNQKTTDKIDEAPEFFVTKWWHGVILGISANGLGWLSIAFVLLASGILILYFFTGSIAIKKTSFYGAITLFALGAFTIFIAGMQESYFSGHKEAIVFSPSVIVKSGPGEKAGSLFVIHEGTKVNVLDDNNGWLKIKLANGSEGWIKMSDAKEI
ncbi:MAG: tetratricopeptide repeat protein [Bacteroidota bacterium]|nr:tetratricopeptide repeat protein [Bacteroidota bacterium]